MKRLAPHASTQLHLPLPAAPAPVVPDETQRELIDLLKELLIAAAAPRPTAHDGGQDAREADR